MFKNWRVKINCWLDICNSTNISINLIFCFRTWSRCQPRGSSWCWRSGSNHWRSRLKVYNFIKFVVTNWRFWKQFEVFSTKIWKNKFDNLLTYCFIRWNLVERNLRIVPARTITICLAHTQCDQKKSPNVYKSCPSMIWLEKLKILTTLQKMPKTVGDLSKLIVVKGFKNLPQVQ